MTLNHYMQPKKKRPVSLKTALKILRSRWYEGEVNNFDKKLAATLNCNLEDAEKIRAYWIKCGFLGFNSRGLLVWKNGGF